MKKYTKNAILAMTEKERTDAYNAATGKSVSRMRNKDKAVDEMLWTFTNLFPHCLQMSIDSIRAKKRFFWDASKDYYRHWLMANMSNEAFLGFQAFNTRKITGTDTIDFIKYRQGLAEGRLANEEFFAEVLAKPKEQ